MIEPSLRKLLTDPGPLNGTLGDRVYLGAAPQDERRARVVITLLAKDYPHTHDGRAGYQSGRVQLSCLESSYQEAHELADAVRLKLDGYEGFGTSPAVEIMHLECESSEDIARAPFEGQGQPSYGVAVLCRFLIQET